MIITLTCKGAPQGNPSNDLRADNLLWFIKSELELGREVHITPEGGDMFHGSEE